MSKIGEKKLGLFPLVFFAIGCMLASGVFTLSGDFAAAGAYTLATIIGWAITFIGMIALTMCYYRLSIAKPELTSGIYSYARAGFGSYIGFNAAWGYWMSAILALVSFFVAFFGNLGSIFPVFGGGANIISVICASVILWLFVLLLLRGVSQATVINAFVVIAKAIPIVFMVIAAIFAGAFKWDVFTDNLTGAGSGMSLFDQVKATIFTTVWIFIGIEGAVVISERAKDTKIAGRATVISFIALFLLYFIISALSMGVMPHDELASLAWPSMAGIMAAIVGPWGGILVNVAVFISIGGALFTYVILCTDSAFGPADQGCFPSIFNKKNKNNEPMYSIIFSALLVELFLVVALVNDAAFQSCYYLSTISIMIPYMLSAFYALKCCGNGEALQDISGGKKAWTWFFAILGSIYGVWMLYASSIAYVLVCALLYAPGMILYILRRKEEKDGPVFPKSYDKIVAAVLIIMFIIAIVLLANGTINPF
ncbi:MAG: basic amino acid/polyamine antiporter [Bacillota bacterium]|nr:basic amino acid/polyamine antiporter [Bacillota bacterium]